MKNSKDRLEDQVEERTAELIKAKERLREEISERKKIEQTLVDTEKSLRESGGQFRLLFERAAVGVAETDMNSGRFLMVNRRFCAIVGRTEEEILATTFQAITHPEDLHLHMDKTAQLLAGEIDHYRLEKRYLRKDGRVVWMEICVSPLWEPGGTPGRKITLAQDITERKRMEDERKAVEAQLLQSQKMEAIGTLAGGIAHDFNNILMGIQGYLSLIQMDLPSNHPCYSRLQGIEEQIGSGASLTRQLLGFAQAGKYEVKPTNLNTVLENCYEIFSRTHKEICFSRSFQDGLWPVEADRKQVEQVLLNIFINSHQAMPEGGDLSLETNNVVLSEEDAKPHGVQPGRYVKISVTDTGTGMDESTKARIFEPFFTTKGPGKGTGLGLASVYGIMSNHGGFVMAQSLLGEGATFTLYLPASQEEALVEEKPAEKKALTGGEKILVVDDEKSNAAVMREILENSGYKVLIAGTGQEAVALYMEKGMGIDLVLLDMIMPGMGGGRTFDALRGINPAAKVILCSGYSADGEARRIMERGCSGFIQKPFRLADITGMIREVIEK